MRKRIFRAMVLDTLAVLLAGALLVLGVLYGYFNSRLEAELATEAGYIAQGVLLDGLDYLERLEPGAGRITWIAADGTVLYDSQEDASQMENHAGRKEIRQALLTGSGRASRFSETLSQKLIYYAQRLSDGTVLRLSDLQYTILVLVLQALQPLCLVLLAALLLALLLAGRLSRQIVRPFNALDLQNPEEAACYDELAPLLSRLRSQSRQIEAQMAKLRRQREEFAAIAENMNEGLLAVDARTRLLLYNSAALRLLDAAAPAKDASVFSLDRSGAFRAAVEDALAGRRCERVVEKGGRCLQVLASPVEEEGRPAGAVVVFWDATERERRESLRREFTANVSHELKTPLTTILGTAELLENGMVAPEDLAHFAGNIRREAGRLLDLVTDIIKLSRLDEADVDGAWQDVDLYALARRVLDQLQDAARRQRITAELSGGPATVRGVPQILEEMVYNLCDNAVAYNREGGRVELIVAETAEGVSLAVSDTGVGIPREEQERVFERFYRGDKSRSSRGTGLGLSIVKHGAAYHGAQVRLRSREGEGTTVTLTFPKG